VIVTAGTPATLAVKKATTSIPLVMIAVGEPISTGIVQNLRHPGGNIPGLKSSHQALLSGGSEPINLCLLPCTLRCGKVRDRFFVRGQTALCVALCPNTRDKNQNRVENFFSSANQPPKTQNANR
jgi:hypothetical protein